MSERSGITPMTPDALRAIARQASSDHFTQGTDLTTAVVKAASLTGLPLTNEHVRRVCEMTYHDAFERAWRETPGQDRYVSFDPPDAVLASQQLNAVKVASATSRRSAMQVVTAPTEKVASAPSRRFDTRAAYGRAVDAAFAPVENPTKVAYANPLREVQALRDNLKEAISELSARESTLESSAKYASMALAANAEQACKEGHKVGEVLFACVSPFESTGYDKASEDLVHELASHLIGRGYSVSTGEKVGTAQVNPNHPLPMAFEKAASFRREHAKVATALVELRRDYADLRRRIDAIGH